eukprot:2823146-Rhodomonas_salina.1
MALVFHELMSEQARSLAVQPTAVQLVIRDANCEEVTAGAAEAARSKLMTTTAATTSVTRLIDILETKAETQTGFRTRAQSVDHRGVAVCRSFLCVPRNLVWLLPVEDAPRWEGDDEQYMELGLTNPAILQSFFCTINQ